MATPVPRLDVGEVIARRRLGRLQLEVAALCALAMFADGYDTQVIGYAAPSIARDLIVPTAALARAFTLGGIGSLLGILLVAPFADRVGRRWIIAGSMLLISATSFLTGFVFSVTQLEVLRFVTGLGLGAVLPVAVASAAEFMPRKHKIVLTTVVWIGYSLGAGFAGSIFSSIAPRYGWPAVFLFGGLIPLVLAPLLWGSLPESPALLIRRGDRAAEIRAALIRISRRYNSLRITQYMTSEPDEPGLGVLRLFAGDRRLFTGLLWLVFFANLMAVFFVNAGLSSVLVGAGLDDNSVFTYGLLAQLGGIVCSFAVAALADRFNRFAVLAASLLLSALSIAAMGGGAPLAVLAAVVAVFFTVGSQNAAISVVAASYPTAILATGLGLALGVGRIGQIAASYVVRLPLPPQGRFILYAVAALVAASAALLIARIGGGATGAAARRDGIADRPAGPILRAAPDQRQCARQLEHLASLGLALDGKRVLEVGAGGGELTGFFLDRDCTLVSTESHPENCRRFAEMLSAYRTGGYAKGANCTLVTADIDGIDRGITESFDIVFCYGLLDRLADPEAALGILARRCDGLFLLETCVAFGDDEEINPLDEGCRPTRPWLLHRLKSLFPYVYVPRTQPAHEAFPLDWTAPAPAGLSRAVFVASRHPLASPLLLDELPARQMRG